jgi:hypothetical protein
MNHTVTVIDQMLKDLETMKARLVSLKLDAKERAANTNYYQDQPYRNAGANGNYTQGDS